MQKYITGVLTALGQPIAVWMLPGPPQGHLDACGPPHGRPYACGLPHGRPYACGPLLDAIGLPSDRVFVLVDRSGPPDAYGPNSFGSQHHQPSLTTRAMGRLSAVSPQHFTHSTNTKLTPTVRHLHRDGQQYRPISCLPCLSPVSFMEGGCLVSAIGLEEA